MLSLIRKLRVRTHSSFTMSGGHDDLGDILGETSASGAAYLNHLTSLPLSTLTHEPAALQTQAHHLTSSLTTLTHTSYPTFISLHKTTTCLSSSLESLSASLHSLLSSSLPALEDTASEWRQRTETVIEERKKARLVLDQHDKIRDLLDIPLLIDTSVRNGYFSEALSLASHTKTLAESIHPPPAVLVSIQAEVQHSMSQMLTLLLATLHEPHRKLPALWKAVNFLRRMEVFNGDDQVDAEEHIAVAFLGGREACLKTALDNCGRDVQGLVKGPEPNLGERELEEVARYLKKYIDVWREGVYDIITQFSTIFLERAPGNSTIPTCTQPLSALHTLLTTYANYVLTCHLLPSLHLFLPVLSGLPSSLPSLLTQLTYCATAFARVGMDFRGVLGGIFCSAISGGVAKQIRAAGDAWNKQVHSARLNSNGKLKRRQTRDSIIGAKDVKPLMPSLWIINNTLPPATPTTPSATAGPSHIPPPILGSYPPVAEFTNNLMTALNGLRLLAPVAILPELMLVLDSVLAESSKSLLRYVTLVCNGEETSDEEKEVCRAAGQVFSNVFVPFARRALISGVYGLEVTENHADELTEVMRDWEGWLNGKTEDDD